MLDKWLENKHPQILKQYRDTYFSEDIPTSMSLSNWLEIFEIDLCNQYIEEVVKPIKVLESLLCGLTISVGTKYYQFDYLEQFCEVVPYNEPNTSDYYEELIPNHGFMKLARQVKLTSL